jgi:heterodisulfide reductase subunit C
LKLAAKKTSHLGLLFQIANDVIQHFDEAKELRPVPEGKRLRAFLKGICVALPSLEHTRFRQRAHIRDIREGDTNSKYFHMKANAWQCKYLIPIL